MTKKEITTMLSLLDKKANEVFEAIQNDPCDLSHDEEFLALSEVMRNAIKECKKG